VKPALDWFLLGILAAVGLAWLFPDFGAHGGALHPEVVNKLGVALIFLLHGLLLPFEALRAGTLRWPLHLVAQLSTFLLFPLAGWLLLAATAGWFASDLRTGLFFLCALPSTVSSSVALTAAARGNVPAAVFNATLSSVLGVFITPFWLALGIGLTSGQPLPLGSVILDLLLWLMLPLAIGQLLRPWLAERALRHKARINQLDRLTILLLVYTSFCDSVKSGVWLEHGLVPVLLTAGICVALLAFVLAATTLASRALGLSFEDRIAAVFCGSKKTLASGVPMARLIFGAHPGLGLILLPILIYHPLQLIVGSWLAGRWAKRSQSG
jgi:sodium/bile acid cotransporter 7